ncbi:MAG: hypothetical protein KKA52_00445, partial [Candidatus Omnitrophica bacterium]|nr:hypothetical protein [Candidatus Omnitrophota bacterium]
IIILIIIVILSPLIFYSFWWATAWLSSGSPSWMAKMKDDYRNLPSKALIKKLDSYNNFYNPACFGPQSSIALDILVERKEKEAVPTILKFLNSWNKGRRQTAIWVLGVIGDNEAVTPLMSIVRKGDKHPDFRTALVALTDMSYDGVFSFVVEIAKKEYPKNCAAINLLKKFDKPESIALLSEIKSTIKDGSPNAKFYKVLVDDAIAHLKSLQQSQSSQEVAK